MFKRQDIKIGTILVYRYPTQSYKYFRITGKYPCDLEFRPLVRFDILNALAEIPDEAGGFRRRYMNVNPPAQEVEIDEEWSTRFEMAKSIDGPWIAADHECEIKHWHENCDIWDGIKDFNGSISRLREIE